MQVPLAREQGVVGGEAALLALFDERGGELRQAGGVDRVCGVDRAHEAGLRVHLEDEGARAVGDLLHAREGEAPADLVHVHALVEFDGELPSDDHAAGGVALRGSRGVEHGARGGSGVRGGQFGGARLKGSAVARGGEEAYGAGPLAGAGGGHAEACGVGRGRGHGGVTRRGLEAELVQRELDVDRALAVEVAHRLAVRVVGQRGLHASGLRLGVGPGRHDGARKCQRDNGRAPDDGKHGEWEGAHFHLEWGRYRTDLGGPPVGLVVRSIYAGGAENSVQFELDFSGGMGEGYSRQDAITAIGSTTPPNSRALMASWHFFLPRGRRARRAEGGRAGGVGQPSWPSAFFRFSVCSASISGSITASRSPSMIRSRL